MASPLSPPEFPESDIVRLLEAERAARSEVDRCEREAAELVDQARARAETLRVRSEARIERVRVRMSETTARRLDRIADQTNAVAAESGLDPATADRLDRAIGQLVDELVAEIVATG